MNIFWKEAASNSEHVAKIERFMCSRESRHSFNQSQLQHTNRCLHDCEAVWPQLHQPSLKNQNSKNTQTVTLRAASVIAQSCSWDPKKPRNKNTLVFSKWKLLQSLTTRISIDSSSSSWSGNSWSVMWLKRLLHQNVFGEDVSFSH